jgi:hypothetical protein
MDTHISPYLETGIGETRPGVDAGTLTFSVPMRKLERMVSDMDESFLITESWQKVKSRL